MTLFKTGIFADPALDVQIAQIVASVNGAMSAAKTAKVNADSALQQILELPGSWTIDVNAMLTELTGKITEDQLYPALISRINLIDTPVTGLQAQITAEATTRLNNDSALASSVETVVANVNSVSAALQTEITARVNGDSAVASSVETIQTTVNGNTTAIQMQATSINGLQAQYTVKINANGAVSGFGLASGAPGTATSEFMVMANIFKVVNPNAPDEHKQVFTIGQVKGVNTVGIDGNLLVDGTIYASAIAANQLVVGTNVSMGPDATITWGQVSSKPAFSNVATSGSYTDLSGKPTIPTNTNQLTDGANLGMTAAWDYVTGAPNATYIDANGIYTGQVLTNQLVAGGALIGTALIAEVLQSTNYVAGASGWKIAKSGSVEFNGGTFRGAVVFQSASSGYANLTDKPTSLSEISPTDANTLSTANSTASSALTAANTANTTLADWTRPSSTLIDGNKIYTGDAYVDTLQIKGQAVTFPMSASRYTTQTIYIPRALQSGSAPYMCASSVTVTMTLSGAPVMIMGVLKGSIGQSPNAGSGFAGTDPLFEILRDSTVIYSGKAAVYFTDEAGGIGASFDMFRQTTDVPTAGSHTYSIRISTGIMLNQSDTYTGTCIFTEASLFVLETKR